MSGGHFNYNQSNISDIANEIERLILTNDPTNWYGYSPETLEEFKKAVILLREAYIYVHRIDWLISGDDGEVTFHERLKEDLLTGTRDDGL